MAQRRPKAGHPRDRAAGGGSLGRRHIRGYRVLSCPRNRQADAQPGQEVKLLFIGAATLTDISVPLNKGSTLNTSRPPKRYGGRGGRGQARRPDCQRKYIQWVCGGVHIPGSRIYILYLYTYLYLYIEIIEFRVYKEQYCYKYNTILLPMLYNKLYSILFTEQ